MAVSALTPFDPSRFFQAPAADPASPQRLDTKVSAISAAADLSGRLSVTTAEGDKITLSADFSSRYQTVNYQAQAQTENGTVDVSAKSIEASLTQQYGVTVEGDLNEQELSDLQKLFHKVGSIFRKFFNGQDDQALAKTAKLADKFGGLSSLSGLDLSINVERSVTIVAAQVASDVTGSSSVPTQPTDPAQASTATNPSGTEATPGVAPSTAAAIPQSSTGTTAPTQPSSDAAAAAADGTTHLVVPATAQDASPLQSLAQQVLDAFHEAKVESQKVRKYLPDFFKKLREDLSNEVRGERAHRRHHHGHHDDAPAQVQDSATPSVLNTNSNAVLAYQAVRLTSVSLSIRT